MLARLSEKSVELNFCAQLNALTGARLLWFGLTQKEEARLGFDVCARVGGRLLIIQFKASAQNARGARRFRVGHDQMEELRKRVRGLSRSVFYAFPLIGTFAELTKDSDFMSNTWLLDVAQLPPLPPPLTRHAYPRKNRVHYVDVVPHKAIIRSEPTPVGLLSPRELVEAAENLSDAASSVVFPDAQGVRGLFETFEGFWRFRSFLGRTASAVVVPSV